MNCRKNPENKEVLWPGGEILRFDLSRVVNDFIWKNTKSLSGSYVERGRKKEQLVRIFFNYAKVFFNN